MVLAAKEPLPSSLLQGALEDNDDKHFHDHVLSPASTLLLLEGEEGTLRPPHKSMRDWVLGSGKDDDASSGMGSARGMGHEELAVDVNTAVEAALGKSCWAETQRSAA